MSNVPGKGPPYLLSDAHVHNVQAAKNITSLSFKGSAKSQRLIFGE